MSKKRAAPLIIDLFFEEIMPRVEEVLSEKMQDLKSDVLDYKVETIGEIQKLREQVTVTLHQYDRSRKRLDRVEKKIGLAPMDL